MYSFERVRDVQSFQLCSWTNIPAFALLLLLLHVHDMQLLPNRSQISLKIVYFVEPSWRPRMMLLPLTVLELPSSGYL